MEIKEIRSLVDLMKKTGLAVFKMEDGDFKITLKTPEGALGSAPTTTVAPQAAFMPPAPAAAAPSIVTSPAPLNETDALSTPSNYKEILSPLVGTFYIAPSPDAPSFVEVGEQIEADKIVCIIEAMKVMNEIKAEISGKIVEIVAENGKPVQFGQVLFRVA